MIVSNLTKNSLRSEIINQVFKNHARHIEQNLINRDEFLSRISHQFNTNDPQQRISSLLLIQYCPSLLRDRLDVQHQILFLLTSPNCDSLEREIANRTIYQIASQSETFSQSILHKIEETMLSSSQQYSPSTCQNLIKTIANVPGDSHCAMMFFKTVEKLMVQNQKIVKGKGGAEENDQELLKFFAVCLRALLRMTIKVPLLFMEATWPFLLGMDSDPRTSEVNLIIEAARIHSPNGDTLADQMRLLVVESISILSRAYRLGANWWLAPSTIISSLILDPDHKLQAQAFLSSAFANQAFKHGAIHFQPAREDHEAVLREIVRQNGLHAIGESVLDLDCKIHKVVYGLVAAVRDGERMEVREVLRFGCEEDERRFYQ